MSGLAERQAALVAALVAGGAVPPGFDQRRLAATRAALLRKRAGEVRYAWPLLTEALGRRWPEEFIDWADRRPPGGGLRDGWDFARALARAATLPAPATVELAGYEAGWIYDGVRAPRRRRMPAIRRIPGGVLVQVGNRLATFTRHR